jgi:pyruvate dehydrogenase E1 component beta subunit
MITPREAINQAFHEEMERDSKVFIIGEEVGLSGGVCRTTVGLLDKFGFERVLDTPISEMGFTGLAVGASYLGLRPIVDFMTWNFSLQAIDHIINSAAKTCYMSSSKLFCPIVFRGPSGFNPGYAAQHTQEFFNWFGSVPGLKVVAPYTAREHKALMKSAIRDNNPVIFLENEVLYDRDFNETTDGVNDDDFCMPLDKARILKTGNNVTVIGISLSLATIEEAVKKTKKSVEIINLLSLNPIDYESIFKSVKKTEKLIIVDFSWPNYCVAHEISAKVYEKMEMQNKIVCLTGKDTHVGYSKSLEDLFYPSVSEVLQAIEEL